MSPFHFFKILTAQECQQNLSKLDDLSDCWTERMPGIPFYTLGTPSYMDGSGPKSIYEERVLEMNPLLDQHFNSLLKSVRRCLEDYLQSPLLDLPGASLPGFHIFGSSPFFTQPIASVHFDLQYELLTWPEPPSLDSVVSFTLPLVLPEHGGGLNWWDLDFDVFQKLDPQHRDAAKKNATKKYLPYEAGKLLLHNGHLLHQIAPATVILPSDRRVTLQGHAARAGSSYYWYW